MIQESLRGESWLTKEQDMLFDLKKKYPTLHTFKKFPLAFCMLEEILLIGKEEIIINEF